MFCFEYSESVEFYSALITWNWTSRQPLQRLMGPITMTVGNKL